MACLLAGCGSGSSKQTSNELRWGLVGVDDVPTLDPALASDRTSITLDMLTYGGLVRLDSHLRVRPDGARRWTLSPDGTTYTFFLRKNLEFASGRAVTAYDFAAAIERALGPQGSTGPAGAYLNLIAHAGRPGTPGIEVINSWTLRIRLQHPAGHFLAELAFPMSYVVDPQVISRYGPNWTDHAAGFGPFSVESWSHGRYLRLRANPHYYGSKPQFKRILFSFYPQNSDAVTAYQRGHLDLVSGFQPGDTVAGRPAGLRRVPAIALDYLAFNVTRPPFRHLNARRALAAVATSRPAATIAPQATFATSGFLPSALGLRVPSWSPSKTPAGYLAAARYPRGKGFPRVALVIPRDPQVLVLAQRLTRLWRSALGLDISVRQLDASTYNSVLNSRIFDLALVRWGADYPDPQDFLATQLGPWPDNVTGWTGRTYARLVGRADSLPPIDTHRNLLFVQAAQIAARKIPIVPLDEPAMTALIRPSLTGIDVTPLGTVTGSWKVARFTR